MKVLITILESGWSESELMPIIDMRVNESDLATEVAIKRTLIEGLRKSGVIVGKGVEKAIMKKKVEVGGKYNEDIYIGSGDAYYLISIHGKNPELYDPLLR